MANVHGFLAWVLSALIGLHLGAALFRPRVLRDTCCRDVALSGAVVPEPCQSKLQPLPQGTMSKHIDDVPPARRRALAARLLLNGEGISEVSRKAGLSLPTVSKYKDLVEKGRDPGPCAASHSRDTSPRLDDASQSWLVSAIKHSARLQWISSVNLDHKTTAGIGSFGASAVSVFGTRMLVISFEVMAWHTVSLIQLQKIVAACGRPEVAKRHLCLRAERFCCKNAARRRQCRVRLKSAQRQRADDYEIQSIGSRWRSRGC